MFELCEVSAIFMHLFDSLVPHPSGFAASSVVMLDPEHGYWWQGVVSCVLCVCWCDCQYCINFSQFKYWMFLVNGLQCRVRCVDAVTIVIIDPIEFIRLNITGSCKIRYCVIGLLKVLHALRFVVLDILHSFFYIYLNWFGAVSAGSCWDVEVLVNKQKPLAPDTMLCDTSAPETLELQTILVDPHTNLHS